MSDVINGFVQITDNRLEPFETGPENKAEAVSDPSRTPTMWGIPVTVVTKVVKFILEPFNCQLWKPLRCFCMTLFSAVYKQDGFSELKGLRNPKIVLDGTSFVNASQSERDLFESDLEASDDNKHDHDVLLRKPAIDRLVSLYHEIYNRTGRKPRVLMVIDVQNTFVSGNLLVPGAADKIFNNLQDLIKTNKEASSENKLFDVMIMSKDRHPDKHISFTSRYFTSPQKLEDNPDSYRLTLTEEGKKRKIELIDELNAAVHGLTIKSDSDSIVLTRTDKKVPTARLPLEYVVKNLLFAIGKNPQAIDVEGSLKMEVSDPKGRQEFIEWFKAHRYITADNKVVDNITLRRLKEDGEALDSDKALGDDPKWQRFRHLQQTYKCQGKARNIFGCLTENFWPDHSNPGENCDNGHKFDNQLIEAIALDPGLPLIVTAKGTGKDSPEAYSAAKATDGSRATGLLQALRILEAQKVAVCGLATGYCPSGTALDVAKMKNGPSVTYDKSTSKGITEEGERAAHDMLSSQGVDVVDTLHQEAVRE